MHNNHVTQSVLGALLLVNGLVVPGGGLDPNNTLHAQQADTEKTITGTITDSRCKGRLIHRGETRFSCTLKCVHQEGADYVLVSDGTVYTLEDHRSELDKFAGGRATVVGHVDGNKVVVDSVTTVKK
jgi:hypothetical protein